MKFPEGDTVCKDTVLREVAGVSVVAKYVTNFKACIQAGGNVGVYPLELAKYFERVYTFEPEKTNFDCLLENCQDEKITAYFSALSDKKGTTGMYIVPGNAGAHYMEGEGNINVMTIDQVEADCGLIWLDIEGAEWLALKGGIETIKRCHPVIVIECKKHTKRFGYEQYEMFEWLTLLGYFKEAQVYNDQVWTFAS